MEHIKTLKIRIKDRHIKQLNGMARSVNFVWNYCNDISYRSIREKSKWLSAYDLQKYTGGSGKELELNSATVQMIGAEYVARRKQFRKAKLHWRKTGGARRSLGWIPFRSDCIKYTNGQIKHNGIFMKIWDSYGLEKYKLGSGNLAEDARGRWYLNVTVKYTPRISKGQASIGIDLGCKDAVTDSTGCKETIREYRKLEGKLGIAQRSKKKKRVRAIHAKIKNRRKDTIHKYTSKAVRDNAAIFVGNVNSLALAKTKMAKSVLDAGWGMTKTILEYKCAHAGVVFEEVNEAYTTQTCSCCKSISNSSPKGRAGLGIREWTCTECGTKHDRDINAAKNILALGHERLAAGIPH